MNTQKLIKSVKGAVNVSSVLVDVALAVALIPIIKQMISEAVNLSATETLLLGLVTLFIIIALVFSIGKQAGLIKGK